MTEMKKILFPIDLTENSSKILPYVLLVSEKYNSMIYLLHVLEDLRLGYRVYVPDFSHDSLNLFQKEALEVPEKAMNRVCEEQLQGCPNLQRRIASGDPVTEILEIIDTEDIDLVIMGTHGRKGLEHIVFGSVAESVVKKSPVPVMTVNPHKVK
ncbi:MAG: universal stress protein [Deltaproteobacteria bacterium]|nr:universal stress protein [Deltaproteobacteria bacterium]MBW2075624.1 universal stress protein [Deltaproteobacteria bacterium]